MKKKSNKEKVLAFSVTKDQFEWEYFPAGGPGGQHQNKTSTACRVTHRPSGAVGLSRVHRSQLRNREAALRGLSETPEFKKWARIEVARLEGKTLEVAELERPTERVRTYDFGDQRVTDHRSGLKTSDVDSVLDGRIDQFVEANILSQGREEG